MLTGKLIKIAIVEDDEDDFFIIANYIKNIQNTNLQVDCITDYNTAIEKIKAAAYNIYFVYYRLGNHTGLEFLNEASQIENITPIVLLTGKGNHAIDIAAMQGGATDYLIKSELNTEKLERCIRYSLDRAASLKKLKERETKYRNLFENSKDAVFIADTKLNLHELNHATTELLGSKTENLIGKSLYDFIQGGNQKDAITKFLKYGANFTDIQIEIETGDKEIKPCLFSISFQKSSEDKWLIHGIIHDITNLKKAEMANIQSQKLASNERLMRVLAHEIRNPLNNINLSVQQYDLLYDDADKQKNFVEIIQRNCNRINQSITELLNLTKPQELTFEKHSLQEILNESISCVEDRINLQKIKIEKKFNGQAYEITADKSKLKIAFSNILVNAIEAMEENKGQLAVSLSSSPDCFTVSIQDNGIGIPEENLSRLFEPFFTLKKNGMGLGLAASYYILQSHKAKIQVESKVNKGTNFIISFNRTS